MLHELMDEPVLSCLEVVRQLGLPVETDLGQQGAGLVEEDEDEPQTEGKPKRYQPHRESLLTMDTKSRIDVNVITDNKALRRPVTYGTMDTDSESRPCSTTPCSTVN